MLRILVSIRDKAEIYRNFSWITDRNIILIHSFIVNNASRNLELEELSDVYVTKI